MQCNNVGKPLGLHQRLKTVLVSVMSEQHWLLHHT